VRAGQAAALADDAAGLQVGEVDDPPAVVSEHDEDAEARGGHGEEVGRDHVADVVGEERPQV
jgi:hypothetical protein